MGSGDHYHGLCSFFCFAAGSIVGTYLLALRQRCITEIGVLILTDAQQLLLRRKVMHGAGLDQMSFDERKYSSRWQALGASATPVANLSTRYQPASL